MNWLLFVKRPAFTIGQFQRLSNIFDNAGQVIFGVAVLTPIISGFDKVNPSVVLLGLISALFCWVFSIWIIRKGENI